MTEATSSLEPLQETAVTVERRGHVVLMGLNRPAKRNAFNLAMLDQLAAAYHDLEADDDIRCGVLFAHGDHFTGGLDLAEVGPVIGEGALPVSRPGRRDPWRKDGVWTTPVVAAVQGWTMTLAIELAEAIAYKSAPLGVKATLASAHRARLEGEEAAFARLDADMAELFDTEDGREGLQSFIERRDARFTGR